MSRAPQLQVYPRDADFLILSTWRGRAPRLPRPRRSLTLGVRFPSCGGRWGRYASWRRERDSNPRDGFPPTHFPGVRLRPLGHLSACAGPWNFCRRGAHLVDPAPNAKAARRYCRRTHTRTPNPGRSQPFRRPQSPKTIAENALPPYLSATIESEGSLCSASCSG
jgi:hypothetical protein